MNKSLDLLCLGEAMVELDERNPGIWHQGLGGDTLNVAVAARRAGARAGYATALGQDPWGDAILDFCVASDLDASVILRDATRPTGLYFVRHDADGHHFSYRRAGSAATGYVMTPRLEALIERSRMLHLSGISLAIADRKLDLPRQAIAKAKASRTLVAFDINYRPLLWTPDAARAPILEAMKSADILLPGLEDMSKLFGISAIDAAVDFCMALNPKVLVVKDGPRNIVVADARGRHLITPPKVAAVDANGAGDCFAGTFLARFLDGEDVRRAAEIAAMIAAQSTLCQGALAEAPAS